MRPNSGSGMSRAVNGRPGPKTQALPFLAVMLAILALSPPWLRAEGAGPAVIDRGLRIVGDVPYSNDRDPRRRLDLYLPEKPPARRLPLIILIHGGGWDAGDRRAFGGLCRDLARRGYAAATVGYRLSRQAKFPAQVEDCKSAVRWLRGHAATYGLDPDRFVVGGHSAGGHLAALLGTTNGDRRFDRGENLAVGSDVQAVLWFAGVGDFVGRVETPGYESEGKPDSGQSRLIGGAVLANRERAMEASPIRHVGPRSSPFLFFHGDVDRAVPVAQARQMHEALRSRGVESELHILPGVDHVGPAFFSPLMMKQIDDFLSRVLRSGSDRLGAHSLAAGEYTMEPMSAPGMVLVSRRPAPDADPGVGLAASRGSGDQVWSFTPTGGGYFTIRPTSDPSRVLSVADGPFRDGTRVLLLPDRGADSQSWLISRDAIADTCTLMAKSVTIAALDDFGGDATPRARIDLWSYNGADPHLRWTLTPANPRPNPGAGDRAARP